jgi:hypothetical protein
MMSEPATCPSNSANHWVCESYGLAQGASALLCLVLICLPGTLEANLSRSLSFKEPSLFEMWPSLNGMIMVSAQESALQQFAAPPELDGEPPTPVNIHEQASMFQELFDGLTLEGWVRRGGQAEFRVEDGVIVGKTRIATPNSFLCTAQEFADFELELEFKVDSDRVNSGVQIRSHSHPGYKGGRVHGYQVEIDPTPRAWTGGIYDEARRGWLYPVKNRPEAQAAFRLGQWNTMRVVAEANRIKTWINDIPVADLTDDSSRKGFIALQVHASNEVMPMEVRWRNIRIKKLIAAEAISTPTTEDADR